MPRSGATEDHQQRKDTDMTTQTKAQFAADILAGFAQRRAAITMKVTHPGNCVLMFEDGIRFIGGTHRDPQIGGFERAIHFGDRKAAADWMRSINGITDGSQEEPTIHLAFNAKQHALAALDKVISDLSASIDKMEA
jgi:hypothetical protein